ncbi:MAG: lipoyl(octanoyl) transferase LipB, partial [Syntrophales bacterium]|nr:lipoyl(octanoyl) transferase LipB [Syntrophales bacterium]
VSRVKAGADDAVLFCQHSPACVVLGRKADRANILKDEAFLAERGIRVVSAPRGGDVTLHNPGQLVVYPVLDLGRHKKDIHWYLSALEGHVCKLLRIYGVNGEVKTGNRGVWVGERKICSIGIAVSRWVSFFGFALNVNNDLSEFTYIRPCGQDIEMTSIQKESGKTIPIDKVAGDISNLFVTDGGFNDADNLTGIGRRHN